MMTVNAALKCFKFKKIYILMHFILHSFIFIYIIHKKTLDIKIYLVLFHNNKIKLVFLNLCSIDADALAIVFSSLRNGQCLQFILKWLHKGISQRLKASFSNKVQKMIHIIQLPLCSFYSFYNSCFVLIILQRLLIKSFYLFTHRKKEHTPKWIDKASQNIFRKNKYCISQFCRI